MNMFQAIVALWPILEKEGQQDHLLKAEEAFVKGGFSDLILYLETLLNTKDSPFRSDDRANLQGVIAQIKDRYIKIMDNLNKLEK